MFVNVIFVAIALPSAACTSSQEWTMSQPIQELHLVSITPYLAFKNCWLADLTLYEHVLSVYVRLSVLRRVFWGVSAVENLLWSTDI